MRLWPEKMTAWGTLGMFLLGLAAGFAYAVRTDDQVRTDATAIRDHETRLRTVEGGLGTLDGKISVVKEDVSWIRSYFDPHRQHTASANP